MKPRCLPIGLQCTVLQMDGHISHYLKTRMVVVDQNTNPPTVVLDHHFFPDEAHSARDLLHMLIPQTLLEGNTYMRDFSFFFPLSRLWYRQKQRFIFSIHWVGKRHIACYG